MSLTLAWGVAIVVGLSGIALTLDQRNELRI